jgi:2-polyprenyl-3-methyl-5-hydroxy-6-metoxy-1,4-benzoquinol methylase
MIKRSLHSLGQWYIRRMLKKQFSIQREPRVNENAPMYAFTMRHLLALGAQRVLDVGPGISAWPALLANCGFHVTAIDQMGNYWFGEDYFNKHYYVIQDDIQDAKIQGPFDAVMCLSVLQHVPKHDLALASMARLVKPGGGIILAFPLTRGDYIQNVYDLPESRYGRNAHYGCQVFSRSEIMKWCHDQRLELADQECYQVFDGNLWTFGNRVNPPKVVGPDALHQFCSVCLRRPTT